MFEMSCLCVELCKARQLGNNSARFPFHKQTLPYVLSVFPANMYTIRIFETFYTVHTFYTLNLNTKSYFFKIVTVVKD